ncbi:MAG: T9SS type A sorting domain-containing protein, partial [Bacteroidota bacterium]
TIFDQYFDGHIDEFRIWTLDRSREQLLLDMNHRLLGDERGLVAYYPFEAFEISVGVNVLVPSFDEQLSNPPGGGGEGLLSGGPNLTAVTPNIKLARPVEDVNFSWVVNDDAIIIIPDERLAAQIERTVLTITVEGVEDLFENRMASPVSWTAFIDQNQVKWSEDFLALEKPVGEELSFTIDIVNLGGTEENFRIENLPLWLTASPQSGTLAPTGSQTITLTVNPGLNTGFYEEDILLRSDFGFDEKLGIDLNVISPRPAWDVNPEDYQFSMSFVGIVEIGGVVSTDRDDIVAAFVGDEVRGVANLQLIPELDLYQVFLTVYSNEATGEQVAFQIWDASIGVIHGEAEIVLSTGSPPQLSIDFLQNQSFGTPSSPILFRATDKIIQRIPLKAGWNWISFNVDSERYSDLNALLGGLNAENGDRMKSLLGPGSDGLAVYDDLTGWEGNLPIDVTRLYKLRLSNADTLAVLGIPVSVAQVPVAINTGWNWISYLPQFNMEIGEALASLESTEGDLIKNQSAFAVYDDDLGWLGSLTFLRPGEGYMLNASNTGSLTYPQNSILNSSRVANRGRGAELLATEESNMTVIAMLEGSESQQNHLIGAYVEGDLVGVSSRVPRNDGRMYHFLTVGTGGRSGSIRFALLDQDLKRIASLDNTMPATRDLLVGSLQEPYIFRLGAYDPLVMYPNPVHDHLELAFYLHQGGQVNVDILDLSGKVISTRTLEYVPSGNTVIKIDGVDALLETGNYLLRLRQNGETSVTKMIKL